MVSSGYSTARLGDAEKRREGIEPDGRVLLADRTIEALQRKVSRWPMSVTLWYGFFP
ncbi:hypothetical protein ACNKHO_00900 [Shigella flexneri]